MGLILRQDERKGTHKAGIEKEKREYVAGKENY